MSMPVTDRSVSGKTSEVLQPSRATASSSGEPGTLAPIGVNASAPEPPKRSAMRRTPSRAITRSVTWRKIAGPSTATDPSRVTPWASTVRRRATAVAATRASTATATWMPWRARRGANASTRTPTRAPPTTTSIGAMAQ